MASYFCWLQIFELALPTSKLHKMWCGRRCGVLQVGNLHVRKIFLLISNVARTVRSIIFRPTSVIIIRLSYSLSLIVNMISVHMTMDLKSFFRTGYTLNIVNAMLKQIRQPLRVCIFSAQQHMLSALYAIARPSVCPSHWCMDQSKTVEVRMMQFSTHSSSILSFVGGKFHPEILTRSP